GRQHRERRRTRRAACGQGAGKQPERSGVMTDGLTQGLRERKKAETRDALASAALRLADERGPDRVTVDDIASAAGVSSRTFFNYFSSKEDAIVGSSESTTARVVDALAARPEREAPIDALRAAIHASADHLQADPD